MSSYRRATGHGAPSTGTPALTGQEEARRIYFEKLAQLLISQGLPGSSVGPVIAELDDHAAESGTDPVQEFGPVGELADTLAADLRTRSRWIGVGIHLILAIAFPTALASVFALFSRGSEGYALSARFIVWVGVFGVAITVMHLLTERHLVGAARYEIPRWWVFVGFVLLMAVLQGVLGDWELVVSGQILTALIVVSLAVVGAGWIWTVRNSRIPVPSRLGHLERQQLGVPFDVAEDADNL